MTGPPIPEWDSQALCAEVGGDLFFPGKGESLRPAKAICARCELRDPCLEYALHWAVVGVWGGTGERERRAIRAQRGITAHNLIETNAFMRREIVERMHARGTATSEIALHLGVTEESVRRILRGAA